MSCMLSVSWRLSEFHEKPQFSTAVPKNVMHTIWKYCSWRALNFTLLGIASEPSCCSLPWQQYI
eukprot:2108727-Amphidinium_carterae.1